MISPSTISGTTPFVVEFRDTSGGAPTAWNWDFDDGTVSTQQDPLNHTFTTTDPTHTFHVKLTASNAARVELVDDGRRRDRRLHRGLLGEQDRRRTRAR